MFEVVVLACVLSVSEPVIKCETAVMPVPVKTDIQCETIRRNVRQQIVADRLKSNATGEYVLLEVTCRGEVKDDV